MKRALSIINLIGMLFILLAIGTVAEAGSGVDPLLSPLPTSQESEPRVTLAPPPMMPTRSAPVAAVAEPRPELVEGEWCASCMTVQVTLCDGQVITLSAQRIEVAK